MRSRGITGAYIDIYIYITIETQVQTQRYMNMLYQSYWMTPIPTTSHHSYSLSESRLISIFFFESVRFYFFTPAIIPCTIPFWLSTSWIIISQFAPDVRSNMNSLSQTSQSIGATLSVSLLDSLPSPLLAGNEVQRTQPRYHKFLIFFIFVTLFLAVPCVPLCLQL